uniref:RNA-dependent RNA polymerase n=1 Tax=Rhizoctonia solani partitivirus SM03 TaxID=2854390 RepID=A0A8F4X820_9VIRU|nr:RNA-dependent RNA polymerase [Rhizoctonia solani virus 717]
MFNTLYESIKRFFKFSDPHDFKYNFEFLGYAPNYIKVSPFHRNEYTYQHYQNIVRKALETELYGSDVIYITQAFHHPVATMDFVIDSLRKGDLPDHIIPNDEHFRNGFKYAMERFKPPYRLRPVHFTDLVRYKWNWHPNVEEPYYSNRQLERAVQTAHESGLIPDGRMSFGNLKNFVFMDTRHFLHQIKRDEVTSPSTLWPLMKIHVKSALTKTDETKVRVIYGVSKRHVLAQAMFFWPLFRYYIESDDDPLLWGFETVLGGIMKMHIAMSIPRLYWTTFVTVDWSGFDLRSLFSLQRACFDEWETWFDFDRGYIPTKWYPDTTTDPTQIKRLWNWQRDACFRMPFVMNDHSMYSRRFRSIPSGLYVTQYLDSNVNLVQIYTILDAMGFDIRQQTRVLVQGDDSVIFLVFHIPADQHVEFKSRFQALATYYFDHVARAEKTELYNEPNGVEVLGYRNYNGWPIRDWRKLLAQLYHPRGAPDEPTLMARCCGITYASMYHPQVVAVCKNIYTYLYNKGVRAAQLKQMRDVILFGEAEYQIPTDHFPLEHEVHRHLHQPYIRTQEDRDAYWPSDLFLDVC